MTPEELATTLITKLTTHSVHAGLSQAIQYGQKIHVARNPEAPTSSANIFCGRKGKKLVFEGTWADDLKATVQACWEGETITPRSPTPSSQAPTASDFTFNMPHPIIYVDGSYQEQGEKKVIGWAFQVYEKEHPVWNQFGYITDEDLLPLRNVAGECFAAQAALQWAQKEGHLTVEIRFDYQGIQSWATGTWRAKLPFTQAYAQDIQSIGQTLSIIWTKVKGHSGDLGNDRVDELASQGCALFLRTSDQGLGSDEDENPPYECSNSWLSDHRVSERMRMRLWLIEKISRVRKR